MIAANTVELNELLCKEVQIDQEGIDRYMIYTPFAFDDGDHYVCVLKKHGDNWCVSDEGNTFMHMSYDMSDFMGGTRERVIQDAIGLHGMECKDGVLTMCVSEAMIAHAVFSFVQAVSKITNVTKFTREIVHSAFMEDFNNIITNISENHHSEFNWHDKEHDEKGLYSVDCKIEGTSRPWLIFAVNSTDKCKSAMMFCLMMEKFVPEARSIAIFEDQVSINSTAVAQLTDVAWKPFSSLGEKDRIEKYFKDEVFHNGKA